MIGKNLAHYEIVDLLGEGGMGVVYRARDPRLGRDVAVKVLDASLVASHEARARFEREARAVAALSHPNVLAIHDVGEHEGTAYTVTELLEGESLQDRLRRGALPLRSALDMGAQIADGLAAAHDRGIVHRDLKPANVFLTRDGLVKILDFGLAKTGAPDRDGDPLGATVVDDTAPGTVLGTVRYMSPEQVRGETVDTRSDLFSFGTVLWEMLTGRVAFDRGSTAECMAAILQEDLPEPGEDDESVPPFVDRILRRCHQKDPALRFRTAQDLAFALRSVADTTSRGLSAVDAPAPRRRVPVAIAALLLLLGAAGGIVVSSQLRDDAPSMPVKIVPLTHSGTDSAPSASPDGSTVAFRSDRDGVSRIWLRETRGGIEAPLTDGPDFEPQFSPDGTSVLFLRREGLYPSAYRVPLVGRNERKLADGVVAARWSPDGRELGVFRMRGDASSPTTVFAVLDLQNGDEREIARFTNRFVYGLRWSPDGRRLSGTLVGSVLNTTDNKVVTVDVETGEVRDVYSSPTRLSGAAWTPDGRALILANSTSLIGDMSSPLGLVHRVDVSTGASEPLFWVQSVYGGGADYVTFSFLDDDRVVFDEILWRGSLVRVALEGETSSDGQRLTQGNARDRQPAFSRDSRRLVFSSNRSGNLDIWTLDLDDGSLRQLTDDQADDWDPAFSHDGSQILWSSNRGGHLEVWTARVDGSGARQLTNDGEDAENPTQTPDGQWILYGSGNPVHNGVWKIRSDGSDATRLVEGSFFLPEVSPTGRYVAFIGNDVEQAKAIVSVAEVETGDIVWSADVPFRGLQDAIPAGRPRWLPDESAVVFVGPVGDGRYGLLVQDFEPRAETAASRRVLVAPGPGVDIESFGIAPDGRSIVVARIDHFRTLKMAEGFAERR